MNYLISSLFFATIAASAAIAAQKAPQSNQAPLESIDRSAIIVDGKLDETVYKSGQWNGHFGLLGSRTPAPIDTSFRLLTDGDNVYLSATLPEPGEIIATHTKNGDPVWRDDSLQLFLTCDDDQSAFYQIVINPLNAWTAIEYAQGGLVSSRDWKPRVKSAVTVEQGAWHVEMAIPIADLKINPKLPQWQLQVGRDRVRREGEGRMTSSWQPADTLPAPASFGSLALPSVSFSRYAWSIQTSPASVTQTGASYAIRQNLTVKNNTESFQTITVSSFLEGGATPAATRKLGIAPGKAETFTTTIPLGERSDYTGAIEHQLALSKDPDHRLTSIERQVTLAYQPVALTLTTPGYRSVIFASQNLSFIEAFLEKIDDSLDLSTVTARLLSSDNEALPGEVTAESGKWKVHVPGIQALEAGTYTLEITYRHGEKTGRIAREIRKLPPRPYEVWIDRNGILYRNGKPFPVYGYLFGLWDKTAETLLPGMFYNFGGPVWSTPPFTEMHQQIAKLAQHNIFSGVYIPTALSSPRHGLGNTPLTQKERDELLALIEAVGDNPSVLAYFQTDEPELNRVGSKRLEEIYEFFRQHDPYRPLAITNYTADAIRDYQHVADICTPDPYPGFRIDKPPLRPAERQGLHIDQVVTGEESYRARWQTPQAYNTAFFGAKGARGPTAREMRTQQVNGMIHGVTGFTWFNQYMVWDEPGVLTSLPYLSNEYKLLFSLLQNGKLERFPADPQQEARGMIFDSNGPVALLICNLAWSERDVSVTDPRLAGVSQWRDIARKEEVEGGKEQIALRLKPFESAVLVAPKVEVPDILDWASVEAEEAKLVATVIVPGNLAHHSLGTRVRTVGFTEKNSNFVLMTIDGMKLPQGTGAQLKGFKPGAGIELTFVHPITPKTVKLISSNIARGSIQMKEGDQWVSLAEIPASSDSGERTISLPGISLESLRIVAEELDGKEVFNLKEVEVY
ncbi:MAG TPA: sugar-binding protein [Chthoniobacteraceae bacterium]|nr:sugar-binding protein [Chthoniobacteraceae bacterium]